VHVVTWYLFQWDLAMRDWREIANTRIEHVSAWLFTHRVAAYPLATIRLVAVDEDNEREVVAHYRGGTRV
jgi:hypothetical protein